MAEPAAKRSRRGDSGAARDEHEPPAKRARGSYVDRDGHKDRHRTRSRSPDRNDRDDRRRDRSPSRDRDRNGYRDRRRDRDGNVRSHRRERSRSRETTRNRRDSPRRRPRSRSRSRSPRRDSRRDYHSPQRARGSEATKSRGSRNGAPAIKEEAALVDVDMTTVADGEDPETAMMKRMMGFAGFRSTKNTKVPGNNVGAVRKDKQTKYRQYMNRVGGFNRPLSPSR